MAKNRPMTQKEIRELKSDKPKRETLTIQNISKQLITLHCKPQKKTDFYVTAQDIYLRPNRMVTLPKARIWTTQIDRLKMRRMITIINDSEIEPAPIRHPDKKKIEEVTVIVNDKVSAKE